MKNSLAILLTIVTMFFSFSAVANTKDEAVEFVAGIGNAVVSNLADTKATSAQREELLRKILETNFDVKSISHFVLGRHVKLAAPNELNEFTKVFQDYIISLYVKQFAHYNGERFTVTGSLKSRTSSAVMVYGKIDSDGKEPIKLSFQLRPENQGFKIVDVRIEGISMVVTLRSDFVGFMDRNQGGVAKLIDMLRQRSVQLSEK